MSTDEPDQTPPHEDNPPPTLRDRASARARPRRAVRKAAAREAADHSEVDRGVRRAQKKNETTKRAAMKKAAKKSATTRRSTQSSPSAREPLVNVPAPQRDTPLSVPRGAIAMSTASVYPLAAAAAFEVASRLGYEAVEVMVWTDPVSQEAGALRGLSEHYGIPICSIHAPTLLLTQRVWGSNPWDKVDNSIALAQEVGAQTVVLHPPFRWQREYAEEFVDGIAQRQQRTEVQIAVENMFPWRARGREMQAYLPHWDPAQVGYQHTTLDLSHTATAGVAALELADQLGARLSHIHLADGSGSYKDEHLVPGRGTQPCAELLRRLADADFGGSIVVEIGTRKLTAAEREADLTEALAFARTHFTATAE